MTCQACLRAQQFASYTNYDKSCSGCGIRELANMPAEKRAHALDVLCHLCGPQARDEVKEKVRVEQARIRELRGYRAKERV